LLALSDVGATETVTVGLGGAGGTFSGAVTGGNGAAGRVKVTVFKG
jgi:hypothetical protein